MVACRTIIIRRLASKPLADSYVLTASAREANAVALAGFSREEKDRFLAQLRRAAANLKRDG